MDTYGDMVTLLMCFFVLLFSMSTMDKEKIIKLVQAFNPDAVQTNTHYGGTGGDVGNPGITQNEVDDALEQLYQDMQEYINSEGESGQGMSVTKGDGFIFISLNDAVFFEGDSYKLLPSGEEALDKVAGLLDAEKDALNELRVLGHTAQSNGTDPNTPSVDRFLASNRATVVLIYLQEKGFMDPARMMSVGYGQWRPVASNETSEGRAQNRRVEIIVSGLNVDKPDSDTISQYYTERGTENPMPSASTPVTPGSAGAVTPAATGTVTPAATAAVGIAGAAPSELVPAGVQTLPRDTGETS